VKRLHEHGRWSAMPTRSAAASRWERSRMVLATPTSHGGGFVLLSSIYPLLAGGVRRPFSTSWAGALLGLSLSRVNVPRRAADFFCCRNWPSAASEYSPPTFTLVLQGAGGPPCCGCFGGLSWLLGGSLLPNFHPAAISAGGPRKLLPITHTPGGHAGGACCTTASFASLWPQITILSAFWLIGLPLSLLAFYWGVRWAKTTWHTSVHF